MPLREQEGLCVTAGGGQEQRPQAPGDAQLTRSSLRTAGSCRLESSSSL